MNFWLCIYLVGAALSFLTAFYISVVGYIADMEDYVRDLAEWNKNVGDAEYTEMYGEPQTPVKPSFLESSLFLPFKVFAFIVAISWFGFFIIASVYWGINFGNGADLPFYD